MTCCQKLFLPTLVLGKGSSLSIFGMPGTGQGGGAPFARTPCMVSFRPNADTQPLGFGYYFPRFFRMRALGHRMTQALRPTSLPKHVRARSGCWIRVIWNIKFSSQRVYGAWLFIVVFCLDSFICRDLEHFLRTIGEIHPSNSPQVRLKRISSRYQETHLGSRTGPVGIE